MTVGADILTDMKVSRGDPSELTHQQLTELREYFNGSLYAFAWVFFEFTDLLPSLHGQLCELIRRWGDHEPGYDRLMIQIPRGSYKTSLCTLANSLWQVTRDPTKTILICNEVSDNSKKWLRAIRDLSAGNKLFQEVYRDILPPGVAHDDTRSMPRNWKWNDEEVTFEGKSWARPESSLTASGVGSAKTGGHWDMIIKDDLVSDEAKNSETTMQRVREWFDSSLPLERPAYKGRDLVVCTPWTYNDVYRYILENYDYKLYRRSIIEQDENGHDVSLLPNQYTLEELYEKREKQPYYFSAQMMCQPKAGKEQSFDPDWIRRANLGFTEMQEPAIVINRDDFDPSVSVARPSMDVGEPEYAPRVVPMTWVPRTIIVDPAALEQGKESKSRAKTGVLVVGIDPWGRRYILDAWSQRANPKDVIDAIFAMAKKWSTHRVAIEEVTFSVLYRHWLDEESKRREQHLMVTGLKPGGRHKESRIEALIPLFQNGLVYLNQSPSVAAFEREYIDYPYGQTVDLLDCLAYLDECLIRPRSPNEMLASKMQRQRVGIDSGRDPVTHY